MPEVDYAALMPWLLGRFPTGTKLHVVNRYTYATHWTIDWWPACNPYGDRFTIKADSLIISHDLTEHDPAICLHCLNRVDAWAANAVIHFNRLRDHNERTTT